MFAERCRGNEPVSEDTWTYCNTDYVKCYTKHLVKPFRSRAESGIYERETL